MATKPIVSYTFATNLNFTVGAFVGTNTKVIPADLPNGFVAGNGVPATWFNYLENINGQWINDWLIQGSALAGVDAHLVETDAGGKSEIAGLVLGNTAAGDPALRVTENTGSPNTTALFSNTFGGDCLSAAVTAGIGNALDARVNGAGTGAVIKSTNEGAGHAFEGAAWGIGDGINLDAQGSGAAVSAANTGTGIGVLATRELGGGPAVSAQQNGGGAPLRGIIALDPTGTPTAPVEGDLYIDGGTAGFGRGGIYEYDDDGASGGGGGGFQKVWTSAGGHGWAYGATEGSVTENAGAFVDVVTLNLDAAGSPGNGKGDYLVTYSCSVRLGAGAALATRAFVEFHDDTGMINEFEIDFTVLGQDKPVMAVRKVTLAAGVVPLRIKLKTSAAGNDVIMKNSRISAQGAYE